MQLEINPLHLLSDETNRMLEMHSRAIQISSHANIKHLKPITECMCFICRLPFWRASQVAVLVAKYSSFIGVLNLNVSKNNNSGCNKCLDKREEENVCFNTHTRVFFKWSQSNLHEKTAWHSIWISGECKEDRFNFAFPRPAKWPTIKPRDCRTQKLGANMEACLMLNGCEIRYNQPFFFSKYY